MIQPRFISDDGSVTLYCADCLEVLPTLSGVDAVVTDPPYGIGLNYSTHDDNERDWFVLMDRAVPMMRRLAPFVVMPNCRMMSMKWWMTHHEPDWIIAWYKGSPGHASAIGFNDWEPHLVWGKPPHQMHDYFQTPLNVQPNGHPCPKPVEYANWLVGRAAEKGGMIADPFMGSGTTGIACIRTGRRFIGIEISEKYYQIAEDRIKRELAQGKLNL